ncbi:MAG: zinc-ribbon domain-containing protein [Promethearchaeota archaeon]
MLFQYPDLFYGGFFTMLIFIVIAALVINVILLVWVYKDSQKRNMNAPIWLVIVIVGGCIGCCIYLLVREPLQPQSSSFQQSEPTFSNSTQPTGQPIAQPSTKFCPKCGAPLQGASTFCPACGEKIR